MFILAFPRACCFCFCFVKFLLCAFFFFFVKKKIQKFKKTKICLVSCFSFFLCLMHLDSPLNSHVAFMDLIPCVLECS
jgi:hypothetical protein